MSQEIYPEKNIRGKTFLVQICKTFVPKMELMRIWQLKDYSKMEKYHE